MEHLTEAIPSPESPPPRVPPCTASNEINVRSSSYEPDMSLSMSRQHKLRSMSCLGYEGYEDPARVDGPHDDPAD